MKPNFTNGLNKTFVKANLLFTIFFYSLFPIQLLADQPARHALLIGNTNYLQSPLRNPVNDARDMADALVKCGFSVAAKFDATRQEMRNAIREFGDRIMRGGVGLFFYAGHGLQVDGENYLVPLGADVKKKADVQDQCLAANYILRIMEEAQNGLNIIILDACRKNQFSRFRGSDSGLAPMDGPSGSLLAYATAPGSVALDGTGRNGLYTSKLLKYLPTPGQRLEDLFIRVRNDVKHESRGLQVPWETQSLTGVFYFVPSKNNTLEPLDSSFRISYLYRCQGEGTVQPIEEGATLKSGDHYKILFTPETDSYVYIFQVDGQNRIFKLFPMEAFDGVTLGNTNPVRQGVRYALPAKDKAFVLDDVSGREKIYFFTSPEMNAELERLYQEVEEARRRNNQAGEKAAQSRLENHFKKRGLARIAQDRDMIVDWDDRLASIRTKAKQLDNPDGQGLYIFEFNHQ